MKKTMLMAMVLLACLGALAQNKTGKNVPEVDVTQAVRTAKGIRESNGGIHPIGNQRGLLA